jgi:hypothetical protein
MQKETKQILLELNADDVDILVGPNQVLNSENVRYGSTDKGVIGVVESVGSTRLISEPQPSVTFITIGSVEDTENNRFIYFKYNTTGPWHKIVAYYPQAETEYDVLLSSQVTGGLNFNKNFPIHSAKIVNDMLYWVEGTNNEPRKINIESGILMNDPTFDSNETPYVSPLSQEELTIIKPPPQLAPNIQKSEDSSFENDFIGKDSFEFAYQWNFYDNETTVVGTYSPASRLNVPSDTSNYIAVQMDANQNIPSTARMVNLIVRISNTNIARVVKTWDKEVASELAEIESHNANIQLLTFNFYNNITGQTVAQDYVLKPFDSVPRYAWALEAAKNRIHIGNLVTGYNTPSSTSLEITQNITGISGTTSVVKSLIEVRAKVGVPGPDNDYGYGGWYVYLSATDISVPGYYLLNGTEKTALLNDGSWPYNPALDPPLTTTSLAGLTFIGASQAAVTTYIKGANVLEGSAFYTRSNLITVTGITSNVDSVMKSRSSYKAGMVFYDKYLRKCGVVTNDGLIVSITSRNYNYTTAVRSLTWSVSNTDALTEIPDWAYFYAPVRTLNLKTRFFVDAFTDEAKYATKDADGAYVYTNDTFVPQAVGIALPTTSLVQAGLGYSFTQGDVAILVDDLNNVYEFPVIDQNGEYIIVSVQDIGDLSTLKIIYEVYSPYQTSDQEPFYEMGQMYEVENPGTSSRAYSVTTDVFIADSYTITRNFDANSYLAEAMSPNDLFYNRWDNDGGKPNFITKLGEVALPNFWRWSNTYIPGTATNGLSTFEALNQTNVPEDCGGIEKLILTSKIQGEGDVMLAICNGGETCSIYLGETQILDATGATQYFAASSGVVGTINVLKGSRGTVNAESVTQYRGRVFWLDANNGRYVQYSANGLDDISNFKMTRFWKLFSAQYLSMTSEEIEALGSRPFIFSIVDPVHDELLISIPKLLSTPPKGYLPDYLETIYPFDIYDGQAKTIVYKLNFGEGQPRWQGAYSFCAENFCTLQNQLYSFKNGHNYIHNQTTTYNEFYGTQYKSKIMFVCNQEPTVPKVYNNISIESNNGLLLPSLTYFLSEVPYVQTSDLLDFQWKNLEGVLYATIMRNKIVPTAIGYNTNGLLSAEKMRTHVLRVMLEFSVTTTPLQLRIVQVGFETSRGHTTQIK